MIHCLMNVQGFDKFNVSTGYVSVYFISSRLVILNQEVNKNERDKNHVEELVDDSCVRQETQDCSLPSFHQSQVMGFDMLSWLLLDP